MPDVWLFCVPPPEKRRRAHVTWYSPYTLQDTKGVHIVGLPVGPLPFGVDSTKSWSGELEIPFYDNDTFPDVDLRPKKTPNWWMMSQICCKSGKMLFPMMTTQRSCAHMGFNHNCPAAKGLQNSMHSATVFVLGQGPWTSAVPKPQLPEGGCAEFPPLYWQPISHPGYKGGGGGHGVERVRVHKPQSSVQINHHTLLLGCRRCSNISSSLAVTDITDAPTSKTSTHLLQPLFPSTIGRQPHHITFPTTKAMTKPRHSTFAHTTDHWRQDDHQTAQNSKCGPRNITLCFIVVAPSSNLQILAAQKAAFGRGKAF